MADYFTQFSCMLDVGGAQNAARALDLFATFTREIAAEDGAFGPGFAVSIEPGPDGEQLWLRDEAGGGDPEQVLRFVKRCAAAFDLTGRWGFQYAVSCSKTRLDAFGGGAHALDLASGEAVSWISTDAWLACALAGGACDA